MPSISEAMGAPQSQMAGDLKAGLDLISASQSVTFTKYRRYILPLDGFLFWIKADILDPSDQATLVAQGSLHASRRKVQEDTEAYSISHVIFTTQQDLSQQFDEIGPSTLFIGEVNGDKFAFSNQDNFFQQAGLFHYNGDAVYPPLLSQLTDDIIQFSENFAVVSNSLPVWLGLNNYLPPYTGFVMPAGLVLYPSFLTPDNVTPPYGIVHIAPETTEAFGAVPFLDSTLSSWQGGRDRVRVTLFGCNNAVATDFLNFVLQYSEDTSDIGLLNIPIIRDAKLKQVELGALAQKKIIDFDVSYQQSAMRNVARQMLERIITGYANQPYSWPNA